MQKFLSGPLKFIKKAPKKSWTFFKRQSLLKKIGIVALLLIIIFVVSSAVRGNKKEYNVEPVKRADIVESVEESGTVQISGQTDIFSPTNGIIEELYVQNGEQVTAGQDLFKVKSTATQQEQQAAYADYLTAKASLDAANSNLLVLQADMFGKWDTFKELAESDMYEDGDGKPKYENRALPEFHIPEKEWLAAEKKYVDQQQVIRQAEANTGAKWLTYQATQTAVVKSTTSGTVANLSVAVQDTVKAPTASLVAATTTKPVLTVADYTMIGVLISLNEADVNKVDAGDAAQIDVDAVDNKQYKGVVARVDEIGRDVEGVTRYDVFVQIQNRDNQLKAGMAADARIVTNKIADVLSVPNSAVRPYKGGRAVQVVNEKGGLDQVPVVTGIRGEERTQIIHGIEEGREVVNALKNEQVERKGLLGF